MEELDDLHGVNLSLVILLGLEFDLCIGPSQETYPNLRAGSSQL